ncbi:MAG: tail fiber domain-containing protein, partial [Patescibacteria group bacterium]
RQGVNAHLEVTDSTAFAAGVGGGIAFSGYYRTPANNTDQVPYGLIKGYKLNATSLDYSGGLQFYTVTSGGNLTQKMVIDNSGNVGIGTASPGAKLEINIGNVTTAGAFNSSALNILDSTYIGAYSQITFGYNAGPGTRTYAASYIGHVSTNQAENGYGDLVFGTRNVTTDTQPSERMRITFSGNVGIGTTGPLSTLSVGGVGNSLYATYVTSSNSTDGMAAIYGIASASTGITAGLYGVASSANGWGLYCQASKCGGSVVWTNNSDARLKKDITTLDNSLSKVLQLRGVNFAWKSDASSTPQIGFLAQEVLPIVPQVVTQGRDGYYAMSYASLTALLVNAIHDINDIVDLSDAATTTPSIYIDASGNIGIGTTTPAYKLHVEGDVAATGFINVSTREAKQDIVYLNDSDEESALAKIRQTNIATYHYISETYVDGTDATDEANNAGMPRRLGLIAEEAPVEILSPDHKGVDLYKMTAFLWSGVKAQQKQIEELASRLDKVEGILAAVNLSAASISSSTPISISSLSLDGVLAVLKSAGVYISNGVAEVQKLMATQVYADEVYTRELCIDDVCINKTQLQALLKNAGLLETATPMITSISPTDITTATSSINIVNPTLEPVPISTAIASTTDTSIIPATDASTASTIDTSASVN